MRRGVNLFIAALIALTPLWLALCFITWPRRSLVALMTMEVVVGIGVCFWIGLIAFIALEERD